MTTVVLGLGNILLGDEGVGVRVVEALAARYDLPPEITVIDGGTSGMDMMDMLEVPPSMTVISGGRS